MPNITSLHLKTALLYCYRFKRGYLCSDEVYTNFHEKADILVDTKKQYYEIEIKISKSDLRAEKYKRKHQVYEEDGRKKRQKLAGANKFYICVPTELVSFAEKWIQEINPKYGLIEFDTAFYLKYRTTHFPIKWDTFLNFRKRPSVLHKNYNKKLHDRIMKRLPSALCNAYINQIKLIEGKK